MVILGGVSVWGGKGTIIGVVLAALVLGLVTFGLGLMNVPGIVMSIFTGALLILVVAMCRALVDAAARSFVSDSADRASSTSARPTPRSRWSIRRLGQEIWSARRANDQIVQGPAGASSTSSRSRRGCSMRCAAPRARTRRGDRARRAWRRRGARRSRRRGARRSRLRGCRFRRASPTRIRAAARSVSQTFSPDPAAGPESRPPAVLSAEATRRTLFARVRAHRCMYPQYWAWRLSGVMASEVTSLGTHTDLWRPHEQAYSQLARRQGWARLMPSMRAAWDRARAASARASRRPPGCPPTARSPAASTIRTRRICASCIDREREAFTVVSSGTWTIVMANRGDLRRLREDRDMLANVNAFGAPVATARYMGGREYEAIAGGAEAPTVDAVIERDLAGRASRCRRSRARVRMPAARGASKAPRRSWASQRTRARDSVFGSDDRATDRIAGRRRRDLRRRAAGAKSVVRATARGLRAGRHRAHLSRGRRHAGRRPSRGAARLRPQAR